VKITIKNAEIMNIRLSLNDKRVTCLDMHD